MFRSSPAILLAAGFVLFAYGQSEKPNPQKEPSQAETSRKPPKSQSATKSESLVECLLRVTGISATSRGLKGDHPPLLSGELWIVDVSTLVRARVGTGSHCQTPIFASDDKSILALCQGGLIRIPLESMDAHELGKAPAEIERLLAVDRTTDQLRIVVTTVHGLSMFAPASGEASTLGIPSDGGPNFITSLEEEPVYGSVRIVSLLSPQMAGVKRGSEIFMEIEKEPKRLTQCTPRMCGQGALSHDGKTVVFVRSAE